MPLTIDIHAHYVSPALIGEVTQNGAAYGVTLAEDATGQRLVLPQSGALRPFFPALCTLETRLPKLDADKVDIQVVSTWTDMAGDELPPIEGARFARLQNETMADDVRIWPDRFQAMGTLPLQDVGRALEELEFIVKHLGMTSVEIGTNINGRNLDHADFRPLWKRIADLGVFVLLHPPLKPVGLARTGDYFLNNIISYPTDTTIAAARLLFSGLLRDLPLRCCLAHGGGFLPYQIGRFDRGFAAHPACRQTLTQAPSTLLKAFYYDTLTHDDDALAYLAAKVGTDRLLYGSDYPFEMLDEAGPQRVRNMPALSQSAIELVLGGTASALLGKPA